MKTETASAMHTAGAHGGRNRARRHTPYVITLLALSLTYLLALSPPASAQRDCSKPASSNINVDSLTADSGEPLQFVPEAVGRSFVFRLSKGASPKWYFVRIAADQGDVTEFEEGKWLAFGQCLDVTLKSRDLPSKIIRFEIGVLRSDVEEPKDYSGAMAYAALPDNIALKVSSQVVFNNGTPPPSPSPTSSPVPSPTPVEVPPGGDWTTTVLLIIIVVFVLLMVGVLSFVLNKRRRQPNEPTRKGDNPLAALDEEKVKVEVRSSSPQQSAQKAGNYYHEDKSRQPQQSAHTPTYFATHGGSSQRPQQPPSGQGVTPTPTTASAPTVPTPSAPGGNAAQHTTQQPTATVSHDLERRLKQLSDELEAYVEMRLTSELTSVKGVNQPTNDRLQDHHLRLNAVEDAINGQRGLKTQVQQLPNDVEFKVKNALDGDLKVLTDELSKLTGEQVRQKGALNANQKEIEKGREEVERKLAELKKTVELREKQDGLYTKIIETIIAESAKELGDDRFGIIARRAGEHVNALFSSGGLPSTDGLQDLQRRADKIHDSLRAAVECMRGVNSRVDEKLGAYLNRAANLASGLRQLTEQLQRGQVSLNPTIQISTGGGSFLEALSAAVRREIEKVRNPREHWGRELDRFVRADIPIAVDICDKEVMQSPGANPAVETHLQALFTEAGLRQILPARGEQFKPSEHLPIQWVNGPPESRETIAQVISRGFYIRDGANGEKLLRTANVDVYR